MADTKILDATSGNPALANDVIPIGRPGAPNDVLSVTAQSIADLAAAAVPSDFQPAIVTNSYYFGPGYEPYVGNTGWAFDTLYAWPFWCSHDETWTRIGVQCTGEVIGASMRLGIYESDANNKPGAILLDAGVVSFDTTGEKEITISQALAANTLYWFACVNDDASNLILTLPYSTTYVQNDLGRRFGLAGGAFGALPGYDRAFTYASLPASWGTPDNNGSNSPALWLRKV